MKMLIVPGYTNSGPDHWQSYWEKEYSFAQRVEQADWDHPAMNTWMTQLNTYIAESSKPIILVAHSLGVSTVIHWAQHYDCDGIEAAFLVAPPDVDHPQIAALFDGYAPLPKTKLPFPSMVVASTGDPYCTIERASGFAEHWGSIFINVGDMGHINSACKLQSWQQGKGLLAELLGKEI